MVRIMTLNEKLEDIKELFDLFDNPKDKYIQLMDMGKKSPGLSQEERNESNKIYGCTSQAWVVIEPSGNDTYRLRTDSDAHIVKGLLSILEKMCNDETLNTIENLDERELLNTVGLNGAITNQRMNGIGSALHKIKKEIRCMEMKMSS